MVLSHLKLLVEMGCFEEKKQGLFKEIIFFISGHRKENVNNHVK
jgi:hypothetical protein